MNINNIEFPVNSNLSREKDSPRSDAIKLKHVDKFDFRVIICDDEKLNLCSIEKMLQKIMERNQISIDIKIASDGAECISYLFQGLKQGIHYDAIISDENMEFINGSLLFELVSKLRMAYKMYDIKLILSTASDSIYSNICANAVIQKPVTQKYIEEVFANIRS